MEKWKSSRTCVNKISIHYYWTGAERPVVVLSHGLCDDGLCWTSVARKLIEQYDVVLLDTRGHGLSEAPRKEYDIQDRANDILGVIYDLGLSQVTLMGHSWGAQASLYAAAYHPELVRGVILEDPPFVLESDKILQKRSEMSIKRMHRNNIFFKIIPKSLAKRIYKNNNPRWTDEEISCWADAKRRLSWNLLAYIRKLPVYHLPQDIFASVQAPILLITGDPDLGAIITSEAAKIAQAATKSLAIANIKNAGHSIRRMEFLAYHSAVTSFLSEIYR